MTGSEHHGCHKMAEHLLKTAPGHAILAGTAGLLGAAGLAAPIAIGAATIGVTWGLALGIGEFFKRIK